MTGEVTHTEILQNPTYFYYQTHAITKSVVVFSVYAFHVHAKKIVFCEQNHVCG